MKSTPRPTILLPTLLALCLGACGCRTHPAPTASAPAAAARPIDSRLTVNAAQFTKDADGAWITGEIQPAFGFDELIYSWHLRLAADQGFRLYLRVKSEAGDNSPWLYAGYWGKVRHVEKRSEPQFAWGKVAMDQVLLQRKAKTFQFKIVDEGDAPLSRPSSLSVIVTDNHPAPALAERYSPKPGHSPAPVLILDLPLRRQADSKGTPIPDRCQSAALATAMQ